MAEAMTMTTGESILQAVERDLPAVLTKKCTIPLVLRLLDEATTVHADALKQRDAIIKTLEARIAELESRPALKYMGVYRADKIYLAGNFCTYGGSLWHCNAATSDVPGQGDNWTLAAKRGNDGNNAGRR